MLRGKCISSALGFDSTKWPVTFVAAPKIGDLVFMLPTIVSGSLNTTTAPVISISSTYKTISAVSHRVDVTLNSSGCYYWEPFVELTLV